MKFIKIKDFTPPTRRTESAWGYLVWSDNDDLPLTQLSKMSLTSLIKALHKVREWDEGDYSNGLDRDEWVEAFEGELLFRGISA